MQRVDALVCSEPGKLHVQARPAPQPEPGEALVRPKRVGICGTDYHIFEGAHPYLKYPRVMGHELAVQVVSAPEGSGLSANEICVVNPYLSCGHCVACRAGKPNCCVNISVFGVHQDGGMAELLSVPAGNLIPAPDLTVDECATAEFLAIGAHAVKRGHVTTGDRALVVGTGPIGLGVALFARIAGAAVVVFDRDMERMDAAASIAAVTPLNASSIASSDGVDDFDVVFDATGNRHAMEKSLLRVAHGGRCVFVSVVKEAITFSDPDFHRKEMGLFSSRNATSTDFHNVIVAIRAGHVPVDRLITHRTNLSDAAHDIPRWAHEKSGLIKALIEID